MNSKDAKHLEGIMRASSPQTRTMAIASGKGGVGKTNIAVNLSICLAASNKKVVLFDADLGVGNVDLLMDINSRHNLSHVLSGQKKLRDIVNITPEGVEVICAGSGIENLTNLNQFQLQRLLNELEELEANTDMMVIDTGAGINATVMGFCMAADHVLVVTTPEPAAMTDAYAIIKILSAHKFPSRISLVVNMANSIAEGKRIYRQIANTAMRFLGITLFEAGVLCKTERLPAAVRARTPVVIKYPRAQITSAIAAMAARLSITPATMRTEEGFFKKVVNLFF